MTVAALVVALTAVAVALWLWRGWRDLNRAQAEWEAHVQQAIDVTDEEDR